jgi:hypothetical protein
MAHFDNLNIHRRRVHNLGARATTVSTSHTTSTTSQGLIISVPPTIAIDNTFSTTATSSVSPSPVQLCV